MAEQYLETGCMIEVDGRGRPAISQYGPPQLRLAIERTERCEGSNHGNPDVSFAGCG